MTDLTIYRLVPKHNNTIQQYRNANDLAMSLLGRQISAYIVIKSDASGDRVVDFRDWYDYDQILSQLTES